MINEYVDEIIKVPSLRVRWGLISAIGSLAIGVTSGVIGLATYGITSSKKDETIQRFKKKADEYRYDSSLNVTKYYGTQEGRKVHLNRVQEDLKNWWANSRYKSN